MKYLKIYEGKQLGNLYHLFDLNKCEYILETNSIKSYNFSNISTTRNKNMNHYVSDSPVTIFKLELDGDEISNNYKTTPFAFPSTELGVYGSKKSIRFEEFEEVIKINKIQNINKYTKKFIIIKDRVERLKKSGWFDSDGGNFNGVRMTIPDYFKIFIPKIKEMFGEIYIQDGIKIIKNNEWIDSIINFNVKKINHGYCLYWKGYKKIKIGEYLTMIEDIYPLDKKNKNIDQLVIGWNYSNIYLSKNKDFGKLPDEISNYDLYIFDFEYEIDNVIFENEKYVSVSSGYLCDTNIILKHKYNS